MNVAYDAHRLGAAGIACLVDVKRHALVSPR